MFSGFYDNIRAGNPEFYSQYPRTWNTTLPGMLTSFGIGSLLSGFLAGILIYKVVNEKELNPGILGTFPALVWALLWGSILGVMTIFFKEYIDDGTLIIIIPIFAMIFGGLIVSGLATILLEKKYDFSATTKEKKSLAIGWAACSLIGVIVAMFF
ncbi:MAG: hypothetical protein K9L30_04775 [Desulfobacterales bacterium]|nr:hypothetical protein [Desulfobacterales bacterium]